MQQSKQQGFGLKNKITASLLSLTILGTGILPIVSTAAVASAAETEDTAAVASAAETDESVGVGVPYTANVNQQNDANKGVLWANATYFDYLSDTELNNGWLNPLQAGTGFNGSSDEWFTHQQFNRALSTRYAQLGITGNSSDVKPLYYGNLSPIGDDYKTSSHDKGSSFAGAFGNTCKDWTGDIVHNVPVQVPNSSRKLGGWNMSVQGLMSNTLNNDKLAFGNGAAAPFFDEDYLLNGDGSRYARVVKSQFPFRRDTTASGYEKYVFDSTDARDNVYFTWDQGDRPVAVNYGSGQQYGVRDGLSTFMYQTTSGYGIFPFNNASNNFKGNKSSNENINYAFGIRTEVGFSVPDGGKIPDTNDPITFDFKGDDDLWVYIQELNEKDQPVGDAKLVLDMGGAHKQSEGQINFRDKTSTVQQVANTDSGASEGAKTVSFDFDYSKTYKMTVFYMERGLIESNCEMSFTMTPRDTNYKVTEKIDTTNVNGGLKDAVTGLDSFTFTPTVEGAKTGQFKYNLYTMDDSGAVIKEEKNKNATDSFTLGHNQMAELLNVYEQKDKIVTTQTRGSSLLQYTTVWDYYNNVTGQELSNSGGVIPSTTTSVPTSEEELINDSSNPDPYKYAELQANFKNAPVISDVKVKKKIVDFKGEEITSGAGADEEFEVQALVCLTSDGQYKPYDLEYQTGSSTTKTATDGKFTIKGGETVTFPNMPVGAKIKFVETLSSGSKFDPDKITSDPEELTIGEDADANLVSITNTRVNPENVEVPFEVSKKIITETHQQVDGATLGEEYTFELCYRDATGDLVIDTVTIQDPNADSKTVPFGKKMIFTTESVSGDATTGYLHTDGKAEGETFKFVIREVLTEDQKKLIRQPAEQELEVKVYYDKANNKLTLVPPDQAGSASDPEYKGDFVNPVKVGDVDIFKEVKNLDGDLTPEDKAKEFSAKVTFTFNGKTYTHGVPFYYYVDDSLQGEKLADSQEITLKHGRKISFRGLPVGTIVKVTETADPEYVVSYNPQEVTITANSDGSPATVTANVINTRQKSDNVTLGVKKFLEYADVAAKAGINIGTAGFQFKLTETTEATSSYTETVTATGEKVMFAPIKFDHAGTRTFTIEEKPGTIPNMDYSTQKFYVSVTAEKDAASNELHVTNITYKDDNGDTVYTVNNQSSVDLDDEAFKAVFKNTYGKGAVLFNKSVLNNNGTVVDSDTTQFKVKVEIRYPQERAFATRAFDYQTITGSSAPVDATSTDGNVTVTAGSTIKIINLPIGSEVKITETDAKGYLPYYTKGQTLVAVAESSLEPDTEGATTTIENQKVSIPVDLKAKKVTKDFDIEEGAFTFTLGKSAVIQTKTNDANGGVSFDKITYEVRSDGKQSTNSNVVIKPSDFKDGVYTDTYTIKEAVGNNTYIDYDTHEFRAVVTIKATEIQGAAGVCKYEASVSYTDDKGTAIEDLPTFTNPWKFGGVSITKEVLDFDGTPFDTDLAFKIDVKFTYPAKYTGQKQQDTTITLSKADGWKKEFKNLPIGTVVTVSEQDDSRHGMVVSYSPQTVTITENDKENMSFITVTNKRLEPVATVFPVQYEKYLKYDTLKAKQFGFQMNEARAIRIGGFAWNDENGIVDFGKVTVEYDKTGTKIDDASAQIVYLNDNDFDQNGYAYLSYTAKEMIGQDQGIDMFYETMAVTQTAKIKKVVNADKTVLIYEGSTYTKGEETDTRFVNEKVGSVTIEKIVKKTDEQGQIVDIDPAVDTKAAAQTFQALVELKYPGATQFVSAAGIISIYEDLAEPYSHFQKIGNDGKIELKHGRVYTINGLPKGTVVRVTEDSDPNYSTSYSTQEVTVGGDIDIIRVNNTLQKPGQVTLDVSKQFTDNAKKAGVNKKENTNKFIFQMTADKSNPVLADYDSTVVLDKYDADDKLITTGTFAPLVFPAEYQYGQGTDVKFTVVEKTVDTNDKNIIYDTSVFEVTYTVSQGASGLVISGPSITKDGKPVSGITTPVFTNDYKRGDVKIIKALEDFDGTKLDDASYQNVEFPIVATVVYPNGDKDTVNGKISAGKPFEIKDLPYGTKVSVTETDTMGMTLKSIDPEEVSVGEEVKVITVTNKRTDLEPADVQIPAKKILKGADISKYDKEFEFKLTGNGIDMTAKNDASGNVLFDKINFRLRNGANDVAEKNTILIDKADALKGKTFTFTVSEIPGNRADMDFDSNSYTVDVLVTATETISKITLSVKFDPQNTPEFVNTKLGKVKLTKVVQDVDGSTMTPDVDFKFIAKIGNDILDDNIIINVSKADQATYTTKYLPVGTVVTFEEVDAAGFVKESAKSVTVKDDTDGSEMATVEFVNKRLEPGETQFPVEFTKVLKYDTIQKDQFAFELTEGRGFAKGTTVKNDAAGKVLFGDVIVKYDKTGTKQDDNTTHTIYLKDSDFNQDGDATLTFVAKELVGNETGMIYDGMSVTLTVVIHQDVTPSKVTLSVKSSDHSKGGEAVTDFVNIKTGLVTIKKTVKKIDESGNVVDIDPAVDVKAASQTFKALVEVKYPESTQFVSAAGLAYTASDLSGSHKIGNDGKVELKHNRTITIDGLFKGTIVRVTEDPDPNYTTSYTSQEATVGGEVNFVHITNTLQKPGQVTLDVSKQFTEDALKAGVNKKENTNKFIFQMTGDKSNPVLANYDSTVVLDKYDADDKLITTGTFAPLVFPAEYQYGQGTDVKFTVVEKTVDTNDKNIIYDTSVFEVTYTVSQGASGLVISGPSITKDGKPVSGITTPVFTNDYKRGDVKIVKAIEDYDGSAITDVAVADVEFPVTATVKYPNGTDTTVNGTISVNKPFEIKDLPYGTKVSVTETDTKGMTLKSIDPEEVTVGEEIKVITVTNKRTDIVPTDVQISAKKILKGADISKYDKEFEFKLTGNGINMTAKNDATGNVLFDKINFRLSNGTGDVAEKDTILVDKADAIAGKVFTFTVSEIPGNRADIDFDTNTYDVDVKVTAVTTLGKIELKAEVISQDIPTFVNPKLGKVKLTKLVKDIDGSAVKPDVDFKFTAKADGKILDDNIIINVSKADQATYTTKYLPVGTVVTFEEVDAAGFECKQPIQNVTVTDDTDGSEMATVEFINQRPQPGQTSIVLSALKTVEGYKLSENDFSFTAKGRGLDETVKNAATGSITFSEIVYKYTKGSEQDQGNTVYLRDSDFVDGKATLNYEIKEVVGKNNDIIYATNTVKAVVTVVKTETASTITLTATAAYPDGTTFTNPARKGSATIIKKDQEGNPVDGVEFTLFKVTSDGLSRDDVLKNGVKVGAKTTSGGTVKFEDLDLYVDDAQTLSNPSYQWYCFAETDPGQGHNLNSELTFFQIPTEGVYDVEFTYMNGKITVPTSGGEGMFTFTVAGSIILAVAAVMLAAYVIFTKKSRKKSSH